MLALHPPAPADFRDSAEAERVTNSLDLDYVDAYRDKLVEPMRRLFKASNLVAPLEDILALKHQAPDTQWLEDMFCQRDLGNRTYALIEEFQKRAPSNSTLSDVSAYGSK